MKKQKKILRILTVVFLFGFLALQIGSASANQQPPSDVGGGGGGTALTTRTAAIDLVNQDWRNVASRVASQNWQTTTVANPPFALNSRIVVGTASNNTAGNTGAATPPQTHRVDQTSTTTHISNARNNNVRAQFRAAAARTGTTRVSVSWAH